jgi:hypothetical protein
MKSMIISAIEILKKVTSLVMIQVVCGFDTIFKCLKPKAKGIKPGTCGSRLFNVPHDLGFKLYLSS